MITSRSPLEIPALVALGLSHHHLHGPSFDFLGVAVASAASWIGVPGPGEPVLIAAGVYAADGKVGFVELLVIAWLAATLGGTVGWLLGRKGGRAVFGASGPFLHFRLAAMEKGERFFERYGLLAIYLAPSWVAGINDVPASRYLPANALCAAIWTLLVGGGGYLVGPSVAEVLGDLGLAGGILLALLVIAGVTTELVRRRRRRGAEDRPA